VADGELYPLAIMDLLFWMIDAEDFGTNLVAYFLGKVAFYLVSGVDFLFCFYLYILMGLLSVLYTHRQFDIKSFFSAHIFLSLL
jgi:hypothetical protein